MAILDIKSLYKNDKFYDVKKDYIFWIIISFGFFGVLPQFLNSFFGTGPKFLKLAYYNAVPLSESYLVSFIFTFLLISTLVFIENNQYSKKIHIILKNLFYIVLLPLFIAIIGFTKISLMVIWVAVLFYLFFRKKYFRNKIYIISLILILAFSFLTIFLTSKSGLQASSFNPAYWLNLLSPFKDGSLSISWLGLILRLIFISIWAISFIFLKIISGKIKRFNFLLNNFEAYKTIEIEIILIVIIVGFLPLLVLNSSSVYYFYDIQRWIAIVFILGCLNTKYISEKIIIRVNDIKKKKIVYFFKFLFIFVISFFIICNVSYSAYNYLELNSHIRRNIVVNLLKENNKLMLSKYKLVEILNNLEQIPIEEKKQTIVYVPQSNSIYWDLNIFRGDSFIIPACTGVVMIDGMPKFGSDPITYYGYPDYQSRLSSKDYSVEEIYNKAIEKGFKNLIIISYSNNELSTLEINSSNINDYIK